MNAAQHKKIKREIDQARIHLRDIKARMQDPDPARRPTTRALQDATWTVERLERQLSAGGLVVTEHAMVRYIERVLGIKPEDIAERVAPMRMRASLAELKNATVPIDGTHRIVIRDGAIASVLPLNENGEE